MRGDVVSLNNPKGGVTRFEWNEQGDLVKQTDKFRSDYWKLRSLDFM
ncbi:hypothetical protein ACOZ06_004131 [Cronobacter muytjensii]